MWYGYVSLCLCLSTSLGGKIKDKLTNSFSWNIAYSIWLGVVFCYEKRCGFAATGYLWFFYWWEWLNWNIFILNSVILSWNWMRYTQEEALASIRPFDFYELCDLADRQQCNVSGIDTYTSLRSLSTQSVNGWRKKNQCKPCRFTIFVKM